MKLFRTTLSNQIVDLDGNEFDEVTFQNCKMRFSGKMGNLMLRHCVFCACEWAFDLHATQTVGFLKSLWNGGANGRNLVSDVFAQITDGAMGQRAANATPPILLLEHQPPTLMLAARDGLMH